MTVLENLQQIRENIGQACKRSNRDPSEIMLIGVTKYVTIERTEETIDAGIINLGENRLEGLLEKYHYFSSKAKWHFIGTLQTRKVKDMIDKVEAIHSLDRLSLAKEIHKRASKQVDCFLQVNVSKEESKHGIAIGEVISFLQEIADYEKIRIIGLMTMAPHVKDENAIRDIFRQLRLLRDKIHTLNLAYAPCSYLSMGMSNDYQIAIEEGATHIRIGSKLVGSNNG